MGSLSKDIVFKTVARTPGDGTNAPLEWLLEAWENSEMCLNCCDRLWRKWAYRGDILSKVGKRTQGPIRYQNNKEYAGKTGTSSNKKSSCGCPL